MGAQKRFMLMAIRLASKGEGGVSPNPLVGAVIVKGGKVVGIGWHKRYGERHAEVNAIFDAGQKARGGTLFVTLEPCNHYGKQPPCTKAIIGAGIKEVFAAVRDPNKGSRQGARELRKHGIKVYLGLCCEEAKKQNEFYIRSLILGRPFIALKSAMTRDGFISYGDGRRKRISGRTEREFVQGLRKKYDAILVGVNTVLKDDPRLTYRKNPAFSPVRVILDSAARTPLEARVLSGEGKAIVVCTGRAPREKIRALAEKGAAIISQGEKRGRVDLKHLMKALYSAGIRSVLVEGGNKVSTSFLEQGLFDRLYISVAAKEAGHGLKAFSPRRSIAVKIVEAEQLGNDALVVLEKK